LKLYIVWHDVTTTYTLRGHRRREEYGKCLSLCERHLLPFQCDETWDAKVVNPI